jgi:hypothetical protein
MRPMDALGTQSEPLLFGLSAMGDVFGKSRWTIRRWIDREGFPACKLPDGHWVTDRELIRRWILARQTIAAEAAEARRGVGDW